MRLRLFAGLILALLFVCVTSSVSAQSAPSASVKTGPSLALGAGVSGVNPDWGHGHILGGTLWIDYFPQRIPHFLHGIGFDTEARDLNYENTSVIQDLRIDSAAGGLIYSLPRFRNFRPYAKVLEGFGNADYHSTPYPPNLNGHYHDSRTITAIGGGLEYRIHNNFWVRTDYDYQFWSNFFTTPEQLFARGNSILRALLLA
jgi:hypothetical protein